MGWENNMANIYGNFVWWQGVVEDRVDPLMLGRCRVRILVIIQMIQLKYQDGSCRWLL